MLYLTAKDALEKYKKLLLFDFMSVCPIIFEPLEFGQYVFKELYIPHSSFYIDMNLFKLKLGASN